MDLLALESKTRKSKFYRVLISLFLERSGLSPTGGCAVDYAADGAAQAACRACVLTYGSQPSAPIRGTKPTPPRSSSS